MARGLAYGVFHSVSAFCISGFDIIGEYRSLTSFADDYLISGVVIVLSIMGGLGIYVITEILRSRKFKRYSLHSSLRCLLPFRCSVLVRCLPLFWNTPIRHPWSADTGR